MTRKVRMAGLAVLALLALSVAPPALASTLTVDLNPTTQVAKLTSTSTTNLVLTYPANSTLSDYLKGYNSSSTLSGSFNGSSGAVSSFRSGFHDDDHQPVKISNMTVDYSYSAKANSTALMITKVTDITASVAGAFNVTNGSVTAHLGWKSFYIAGPLDLALQGHNLDVNLAGPSIAESINGRALGAEMLTGMFEGDSLWSRPTLNFSALSTPLSNWTRNYDPVTNTTTYSKTVTGNSTFTASYNNNGQAYSLKMISDPSAVVSTQGYSHASGDSLVFSKAPVYLEPLVWVAAAALAIVAVVGGIYLERRSRLGIAKSGTLPG